MQDKVMFCPFLSINESDFVECQSSCMLAFVDRKSGTWICSLASIASEIKHYRGEEHGPGWELVTEEDEEAERQEPPEAGPEQDSEAGQ